MKYEIDNIYCGECAEMMSHMPDGCIDLTVTSPPYDNLRQYNGYTFDFEAIAQQLWRVTKPGGVVVWVVGDATVNGSETGTSFRQALYFIGLGFNMETMIYQKDGTSAAGNMAYYLQVFEYMFVFSKGSPATINLLRDRKNKYAGKINSSAQRIGQGDKYKNREEFRYQSHGRRFNVWLYNPGNNEGTHPASFPEALARDHILSWSNPGDLVLDPMCGSGTVPKMCVENGRHFLAFDISDEYVNLSKRRVAGARIPLFVESNGTAVPIVQGKLLEE